MNDHHTAVRLTEGLRRDEEVKIFVDGRPVKAYPGEMLATAMLAAGCWTCQTRQSRPFGVFCNIGVCYGCLVRVEGVVVRSCQTEVRANMQVETLRFEKEFNP